MTEQVVVDLPERRRNRSPQRQAPVASPSPRPTPSPFPAASPSPAEDCGHSEGQGPAQVVQRPFSSRSDGGVGWVEPDATLATFTATAETPLGLEADPLKAQGAAMLLLTFASCRLSSRLMLLASQV